MLEPYGLVLKAGVWYLCARADTGAYRVYRIDRFTAVAAGAERFDRDGEFDLPGFWAERGAQFARALLRTSAVVRLSAEGRGCCGTRWARLRPGRRWRSPGSRTRGAG